MSETTRTFENGTTMPELAEDVSRSRYEVAHRAANLIDEQRERATHVLRDVAQTVRARAAGAPLPGIDRAAAVAVKPLESGAAYVEQHRPQDIWSDFMQFCRAHPVGALAISCASVAIGCAGGYLVKKLLR